MTDCIIYSGAGCASTGAHFNPMKTKHGGPNDVERFVSK